MDRFVVCGLPRPLEARTSKTRRSRDSPDWRAQCPTSPWVRTGRRGSLRRMSVPPFDLQNPTDEHRMLRQMVRDFTREVIEPQAEEHDEKAKLNVELMRRAGELGLLGITIPAEDGGAGMDALGAVIVHHEMAKSDPGFTLAYLAHSMLFVNNFY